MRKVFLSAAALTGGLMLHGAFACELNREASQPAWAIIVAGACSGSNCFMSPAQESLTGLATEKGSPVDPAQNCAVYFDPGTYSGSDGLLDWLVASLGAQSQYKPAAGFAPSPMDANAQYR